MSVVIDIEGVANLSEYFAAVPGIAAQALSLSLNDTARGTALKAARRDITAQVNFPEGYLTAERLGVTEFATPTKLRAVITGRDRPTSLARFAKVTTGVKGAVVTVHPGRTRTIPRGFLVGLNRGVVAGGNVGFAIRLGKGETVRNIREFNPIEIFPDVFLLYGPSVNQVFGTVADDIKPEVASALRTEFLRQFDRLLAYV